MYARSAYIPSLRFISSRNLERMICVQSSDQVLAAYKAARLRQIPGCFAVGRLYRVNWPVFLRRAGEEGRGEDVEEEPADSRLPR